MPRRLAFGPFGPGLPFQEYTLNALARIAHWSFDVITTFDLVANTAKLLPSKGDTNRASSTTLVMDPYLQFPVVAGGSYSFRSTLFFTSLGGDFKYAVMGSAGVTATFLIVTHDTIKVGSVSSADITQTLGQAFTVTGAYGRVVSDCSITVGGADGQIGIGWAQNTSNVGATTLKNGSRLEGVGF